MANIIPFRTLLSSIIFLWRSLTIMACLRSTSKTETVCDGCGGGSGMVVLDVLACKRSASSWALKDPACTLESKDPSDDNLRSFSASTAHILLNR